MPQIITFFHLGLLISPAILGVRIPNKLSFGCQSVWCRSSHHIFNNSSTTTTGSPPEQQQHNIKMQPVRGLVQHLAGCVRNLAPLLASCSSIASSSQPGSSGSFTHPQHSSSSGSFTQAVFGRGFRTGVVDVQQQQWPRHQRASSPYFNPDDGPEGELCQMLGLCPTCLAFAGRTYIGMVGRQQQHQQYQQPACLPVNKLHQLRLCLRHPSNQPPPLQQQHTSTGRKCGGVRTPARSGTYPSGSRYTWRQSSRCISTLNKCLPVSGTVCSQ